MVVSCDYTTYRFSLIGLIAPFGRFAGRQPSILGKPAPCHDAGVRSSNRSRDATIGCSLQMPWRIRSTSGTDAEDVRA
jgi:hypothetical protein